MRKTFYIVSLYFTLACVVVLGSIVLSQGSAAGAQEVNSDDMARGQYFRKKAYIPEPLPQFNDVRNKLPNPIISSRPELVDMYWRCWQLSFAHLMTPPPHCPFISNWQGQGNGFLDRLFQWDSCFMVMYGRYANAQFPAVGSLDNFYSRQRRDGYICREFFVADGSEAKFGYNGGYHDPNGWKNTINPPLFAWAECESFKVTGDKSRFALVLPVLEKYLEFINRDGDPDADPKDWEAQGRRSVGTPHQLYWNTPLGSGMDDIPKPTHKGAGWVDMSCQMVMQYHELALICRELGQDAEAANYDAQGKTIGDRINQWCWNEDDGFYYDVLADGSQFKKKTACGFWPMIAGIASPEQVKRMVAHLKNEKEFWRPFVFPALSADEQEYNKPSGAYWRGAVWAPTNYEIIKGLQANGEEAFATEATEKYLAAMAEVFKKTGTVYENYMPEQIAPSSGRGDFVGWSAIGPITLLIENVLGFRPDGVRNRLDWRLTRTDRHGIERLHVGNANISATCAARANAQAPAHITVTTDQPFKLTVWNHGVENQFDISTGSQDIKLP